jgi:hypothetical protein
MEYCEIFLSKITKGRYPDIYDNLDIEKMKKIIQENIDYLIKLKGEKAIEEMINNDKLIEYFQWLVKEKTILYIPKEFLTYIYLIKERFGGKVLEDLISMLIKYEEIFQISTTFIIKTIGKNIENLGSERINVLLEILEYLINEKYKLKIFIYEALSDSLNLIVDKDIDIKIAKDFIIKVIGSFSGRPYLIIKLKDSIPKEKFSKLLNIFSSNGLYYKVQNEEDLKLFLNQVNRDPSIIDFIDNVNFEKMKAKDFLFILTKYFENIYFNEKINQEVKLEIYNQLINKGGRIVRYIIIHTNNKKLKSVDYDKLYNVINLMGKDLFTKYPNILKYYPQFVSFRLYRLINSEKDLEYLEKELNKRDPYELITDSKILEEIYKGIISKYSLTLDYLIKLLDHIVKKYGKKRKLITKILDAIEETNKFDKSSYLSTVLAYRLFHIKDNIGKIGAWCDYFSHESIYYKWILINFKKKLEKMIR